jgi:hypothetical protein
MPANVIKKDPIDAFSYPSKKPRPLGKEPLSVPRDPMIEDFTPFEGGKAAPQNFFYSLYFTAFDVRDYGPDIKKFMKVFSPLSIKKAYLETYRDGYSADVKLLENLKKALEKEGVEVSGGITTTHFSDKAGFNSWPSASSCYTDRDALKRMKKEFETAAGIFDEIIIDDWFFTVCECPGCVKAKGKKDWGEFRGRLMADAAEKYMIAPAKKANKKVSLVLKLPQWYERFVDAGYDMERLLPLFPEIAVGTESRNPHNSEYMPVHGSLIFNYISRLATGKASKAWFDIYNCTKEVFAEQAYQSVLGGARELILFCAGILPQPLMRPLVAELIAATPKIDRLAHFKSLFKVPMIRRTNAVDSHKLEQYLQMAGIPLFVTPEKLPREKMVIMTGESCLPAERAKVFNAMVKGKKDMFITADFAAGAGRHFKIKKLETPVRIDSFKYNSREENVDARAYIDYDVQGGKETCLVNGAYSLVSCFKVKDSAVWVFNTPRSKGELSSRDGHRFNEGLRFLLRSSDALEALKAPFNTYVNVNLYDKIKTLYRHSV